MDSWIHDGGTYGAAPADLVGTSPVVHALLHAHTMLLHDGNMHGAAGSPAPHSAPKCPQMPQMPPPQMPMDMPSHRDVTAMRANARLGSHDWRAPHAGAAHCTSAD